MARWDSLRRPLQYTRRSPDQQAADARRAYTTLTRCQPPNLGNDLYRRYLEVLDARMSNRTASLAELAAMMSPPLTKEALAAHLRRAHAAAGVPITRTATAERTLLGSENR